MSTTVDYDAPRRRSQDEPDNDALAGLGSELSGTPAGELDDDLNEMPDRFELPGADLSGEEFSMTVIPRQTDEFMCGSCFLVQHQSRRVNSGDGASICADCA